MPFPLTSGVLDDFNRANGGLGANWTGPTWGDPNALQIIGNQVSGVAGYACSVWNTQLGPDCEIYGTWGALDGASGSDRMLLRFSAASGGTPNGYSLRLQDSGSALLMYKVTSGTESLILTLTAPGTGGSGWSVGDGLGFQVVGNLLSGWWKHGAGAWTLMGSVTDNTYLGAGYAGFELPDATVRVDDFSGGTIVPAAQSILLPPRSNLIQTAYQRH